MTNKQREQMYAEIKRHGENLLAMFPNATPRDPVALCKRLRRVENLARIATTCLCNTGTLDVMESRTGIEPSRQATYDEQDEFFDKVLKKVDAILGPHNAPIFINHDPRGCALKIKKAFIDGYGSKGGAFFTDWGGDGILAPDFTPDN